MKKLIKKETKKDNKKLVGKKNMLDFFNVEPMEKEPKVKKAKMDKADKMKKIDKTKKMDKPKKMDKTKKMKCK